MVTYTVTDGTTTYPLMEMEIDYTGTNLDVASFTIAGKFADDELITIYADSTIQFYGYVKEVEEIQEDVVYKHTAYELAVELKTTPYLSSSADVFVKTSTTIGALATDIVTSTPASGWTIDSSSTDSTAVASINFYMVNRLQALNKVLREMRGYFVLFDSLTKKVKYINATTANTDRTATPITYNTKSTLSSSMLRNVGQVVVIGKDTSIRATSGTGTSRVNYQVDDITDVGEAQKIADSIYADIGVAYNVYNITIHPDQIQYDVRDKVRVVGDLTDYYIKELVQGMDEITLTLDTGKTSVIDSLGSRIHLIEGDFPSGSDASWSGGNTNVTANGAAYTTYIWEIADVNMIANSKLDAVISAYDSSVSVATSTGDLSSVSTIISDDEYTDDTYFSSATYVPSSSGITCTAGSGYQFGIASIYGSARAATAGTYLAIVCQYSTNGSTWSTIGVYDQVYCVLTTDAYPIAFTVLIPGHTGTVYVRWRCTPSAGTFSLYSTCTMGVQLVSRHTHPVATTYDKSTAGTAPTTLQVHINSGTDVSLTPGTALPLSGTIGTLTSGKNIIYIKTPSGTSNQCSVNPTITYQTLGKS